MAVVREAIVDCGGEDAVASVEEEDAEAKERGEESELEGGADYAAGHGGMRGTWGRTETLTGGYARELVGRGEDRQSHAGHPGSLDMSLDRRGFKRIWSQQRSYRNNRRGYNYRMQLMATLTEDGLRLGLAARHATAHGRCYAALSRDGIIMIIKQKMC